VRRKAIFAFCAAAIVAGALCAHRAGAAPPHDGSTSITLPAPNETFPGGAEAGPARRNCLTCHSSDYVYTQPKLSKAQWTAEVTKMIKVYGAPVPQSDIGPIVDYLVAQNGTP
jgi:hypothetical protein